MITDIYNPEELDILARELFKNERNIMRLDGWFLVRETCEKALLELSHEPLPVRHAMALQRAIQILPISIDDNTVFAGTQRDAFARSYALINPTFRVATFNGYCDPSAVFNDIDANEEFPSERIEKVREMTKNGDYVKELSKVYEEASKDTSEVAYFIEQVTGHLIPDMRKAVEVGIGEYIQILGEKIEAEADAQKKAQFRAMKISLESTLILTRRYQEEALKKAEGFVGRRRAQLLHLASTLEKVPREGATNLFEAIQSFLLLWQVMCLEQAPNPFAFSVGNADRIFEPFRQKEDLDRDVTAGLFKHFLVFYNVGDRSWAISQNVILGGRDVAGNDLSNPTTYALFDAYYDMNLPQPILSVKLHKNTPDIFYQELGRFCFTPGALTPSFFNDDAMFEVLLKHGVEEGDLPDYSIAGCQEPLIMGRDNGNTTNSWLNLAKILELSLNNGKSILTGEQMGPTYEELTGEKEEPKLANIRETFSKYLQYYTKRMAQYGNGASKALSNLPVPFLSCFMGGMESGIDTRDVKKQGTKYNGSGCLIHGVAVVGDSLVAIDDYLESYKDAEDTLLDALKANFEGFEDLRKFLLSAPKFGNHIQRVDDEVARLTKEAAQMVRKQKNYLGNSFRPDYSSPTTHLLYGSWVGALPDGRLAKDMLNYGVDPLHGDAGNGLGFRVLSAKKLPYMEMEGGYASHLGLDPRYFRGESYEEKGMEFKNKIINTLFFSSEGEVAPFYLYVNVTTPEILRKVLANPKKYAPSGVYIMRIHGTFVNFLDLSPEIQEDIITRLDLSSTTC